MAKTYETVFDFTAKDIDGNDVLFDKYKSQVLLIVNTASGGQNNRMLEKLSKIQDIFQRRNFSVLAFPCNQFGYQEKGDNQKIKRYYLKHKGYSFDLYSKIKIKGREAHPLFRWLRSATSNRRKPSIRWNFHKFLVDSDGVTVWHFGYNARWSKIVWKIEECLEKADVQAIATDIIETNRLTANENMIFGTGSLFEEEEDFESSEIETLDVLPQIFSESEPIQKEKADLNPLLEDVELIPLKKKIQEEGPFVAGQTKEDISILNESLKIS